MIDMLHRFTQSKLEVAAAAPSYDAAASPPPSKRLRRSRSNAEPAAAAGCDSYEAATSLVALREGNAAAIEALGLAAAGSVDAAEAQLSQLRQRLAAVAEPLRQLTDASVTAQTEAVGRGKRAARQAEESRVVSSHALATAEVAQGDRLRTLTLVENLAMRAEDLEEELRRVRCRQLEVVAALARHEREEKHFRGVAQAAAAEAAQSSCEVERAERLAEIHRSTGMALLDGEAHLKDSVEALDGAFEERLKQRESQFRAWPADEVAAWLRRAECGRFAAHAQEFMNQGVTGHLLCTVSHDELVALGIRDLAARRALLEGVRRLSAKSAKPTASESGLGHPVEQRANGPPEAIVCPILRAVMLDPVAIAGDEQGHGYERRAIEQWFAAGRFTVPLTNKQLRDPADRQLLPLRALARTSIEWRRAEAQRLVARRDEVERIAKTIAVPVRSIAGGSKARGAATPSGRGRGRGRLGGPRGRCNLAVLLGVEGDQWPF